MYRTLPEEETVELLHSQFHEARLLALFILVRVASKGDQATKQRVYDLYLKNCQYVNNWDLVDSSPERSSAIT
jgi:3-methyladenine DNA glycosylase AlkD